MIPKDDKTILPYRSAEDEAKEIYQYEEMLQKAEEDLRNHIRV